MGVQDLHQARDSLPYRPLVPGIQIRPEGELLVYNARVVLAAGVPQRLSQVVRDEAIVVGEEALLHLGRVPAGKVEVKPVEEGSVYHGIRHADEEVLLARQLLRRLVEITEEHHRGLGR